MHKVCLLTFLVNFYFTIFYIQILSSEAKLTQANEEVTEIKAKQIKMITELYAQRKQLYIEMDKIRLESEIGFHDWENKVNLLKTENCELNAKVSVKFKYVVAIKLTVHYFYSYSKSFY